MNTIISSLHTTTSVLADSVSAFAPHIQATLSQSLPAFFAIAPWTSISDMKAGVGQIAGMIILVGWLLALIAWFVAAGTKDSNPGVSKQAFYIVWMFAVGAPVVGLVFTLFVGPGGTPTPTF